LWKSGACEGGRPQRSEISQEVGDQENAMFTFLLNF
jgi:hypothetical protein